MHPEAPRTVLAHLRDDLPLPPGLGGAVLAHAHPTLTALRLRLGPGLDTSRLKSQYLNLRTATPVREEEVEALVERMHRALRSDRDIMVTITPGGEVLIDAAPLGPLRSGDEAWLWVRLFNDSDRLVACRVVVGDRVRRFRLPPGASRSYLHQLEIGSRGSLPVSASVGRGHAEATLELEVRPSRRITLVLPDGPARLVVRDALGPVAPAGAPIRRDLHGRWYFHGRGQVSLWVHGRVEVEATRGPEHEPLRLAIEPEVVPERPMELRPRRRLDLARDGWVSADLHAHLHYGGEYLLDSRSAALIQAAEGLDFLNLLVANQESEVVHDRSSFDSGPRTRHGRTAAWGEEFRNDFYGHVTLTGASRLVEPVYSGFRGTRHAADFPSTIDTAERARSAGALVSSAHPVIFGASIEEVFRRPRSVEAKELPVLAALGLVDAIDVLSYPGDAEATARLWYRLLDCGLRIAASAGGDAFMNVADGEAFMAGEPGIATGRGGCFSSPPGGTRVYARVNSPGRDGLADAIRAGRTFVTNGPFLRLAVDGESLGETLMRDRRAALTVEASTVSLVPLDSLDLVVNGRVRRRQQFVGEPADRRVTWRLPLERSAWIALCARGGFHPDVMDAYAYAHTSPIYVEVGGQPIARRSSFEHFVRWIDRLDAEVTRHCRFDDEDQERSVRDAYARARRFYAAGASR